jgi:hypothetical protein
MPPTNGNRPGEGAAHSVGEFSQNATEGTRQFAAAQGSLYVPT